MKRYILIGPLCVLGLWFAVTLTGLVDPLLLPGPVKVFAALGRLIASQKLWVDLYRTVLRWLSGVVLGVCIGVPLGIILGYFDRAYRSFELIIDFFRSVPSLALFPLFFVLFGLGEMSKVSVAAWATLVLLLVNTVYGVKYARASRLRLARLLGATTVQVFTKIVFPSALPHISAGMRVALSIALIVTVGSEMILGGQHGLGKSIMDASFRFDMSEMYATLIVVGVIGYVANRVFLLLEHKAIHWRGH